MGEIWIFLIGLTNPTRLGRHQGWGRLGLLLTLGSVRPSDRSSRGSAGYIALRVPCFCCLYYFRMQFVFYVNRCGLVHSSFNVSVLCLFYSVSMFQCS